MKQVVDFAKKTFVLLKVFIKVCLVISVKRSQFVRIYATKIKKISLESYSFVEYNVVFDLAINTTR